MRRKNEYRIGSVQSDEVNDVILRVIPVRKIKCDVGMAVSRKHKNGGS